MARSRVLRLGWGHFVAIAVALLTAAVLLVPGVLLALSASGVYRAADGLPWGMEQFMAFTPTPPADDPVRPR